jgi:hypothetical protein
VRTVTFGTVLGGSSRTVIFRHDPSNLYLLTLSSGEARLRDYCFDRVKQQCAVFARSEKPARLGTQGYASSIRSGTGGKERGKSAELNTIKCMSLFFKRNVRQAKRTLSWFPQIVRREGEALQGETIRVSCGILNKRISEN